MRCRDELHATLNARAGSLDLLKADQIQALQGLRTETPVEAKSAVLRVTTVMLWTRAVAAMRESYRDAVMGT